MSLAVTVTSVSKQQRTFLVRGTITPSGSYAAGGDVLNFAAATFPLGVDGIKSSGGPISLLIWSQKGSAQSPNTAEYIYGSILGSTQLNSAMQVFTGGGSSGTAAPELAAGAYPAAVSGDNIQFEASFPSA